MSHTGSFVLHPFIMSSAVREFWKVRGESNRVASQSFNRQISELVASSGIRRADIYTTPGLTDLPGYFCPNQSWDILVVSGSRVVAAITIVVPDTRDRDPGFPLPIADLLSKAVEFEAARKGKTLEAIAHPFLGCMCILEDSGETRACPVPSEPHFPIAGPYRASWVEGCQTSLRRLVEAHHYSAACLLLVQEQAADSPDNYREPDPDLSARTFLSRLLEHCSRP